MFLFKKKKTFAFSHHQQQLSPRNLYPPVPVGVGGWCGEEKRVTGDEVNNCIHSMQSCSRWEGGRVKRREAELGETQCWYFRVLSSLQALLPAGVGVEGLAEGRPVCWKAIRLKKLFNPSSSAGYWNNPPCLQKDAAEGIGDSCGLDWASGEVCYVRQAGTRAQALPSSRGIPNSRALQASQSPFISRNQDVQYSSDLSSAS